MGSSTSVGEVVTSLNWIEERAGFIKSGEEHSISQRVSLLLFLLADLHWNDANLSVIDWHNLKTLGDECEAQRTSDPAMRLDRYKSAVRANRQLP